MPTNYKSADFSQLYRKFKKGAVIDDLTCLDSLVGLGKQYAFFQNLDEHIGFLERGCAVLDERRNYLKVRQSEVVKLTGKISLATGLEELIELHRRLNVVAIELALRGVKVMEIHDLITGYRHRLTEKVIALVCEKLAPLPCEFTWFNMGSDGRCEQTFFTDQDNALVYEIDDSQEIDAYFENFAEEVVTALDRVGFSLCTGNIMPTNPNWRGSLEGWSDKLEDIFHDQSQENLLRVIILMDIAYSAGSASLSRRLIDKVHQMIQDNFGALMVMARSAIMSNVALTMFKNFRLEKSGDHRGMFNVKLFGWAPLIMTVRVFALKYGFTDTNTVARIKHLEARHHFEADFSLDLQKAYRVLTYAKMVSQVEAIVSGCEYDYFLDPETLKDFEQDDLKRALGSVEALQKLAYNSFLGGGAM